jgi:hypothetical protein
MVQPDCAGVIPPGPVSWYAVARPLADSGFAGTMMSQLTLAAVVVALLVAVGVAPAPPLAAVVGHGAADAAPDAGLVGAAVVVAVADDVGAAVPEVALAVAEAVAVGDPLPPPPWWPAALAGLAGSTYAAGEAQLAFAASATLLAPEWSTMATMAPTATTSATGMATGTAKRESEPRDRRPADRCLLGMQSTSIVIGDICVFLSRKSRR